MWKLRLSGNAVFSTLSSFSGALRLSDYEFTACPAAEFAVKHDLTDIMPALCNVDFASMELIHARLVRKGTCVDGCKCDYTICGDKDPYLRDHPEYRDDAGYRRNK